MDYSIKLSNRQILRGFIKSPSENLKGMVIMVHGIGEHINRYSHWADLFLLNNFGFTGVDLPGHGRSDGRRGHIKSGFILDEMIDIMVNECSKTFPGVPLFIYGHSLGGTFSMAYLLKRRPAVKGGIITSPAFSLAYAPGKVKIWLASVMKYILPGLQQPTGLPVDHLSQDKGVVEKYIADPLVHEKISVSLFNLYIKAVSYCFTHASALDLPVLMVHGSEDRICSPGGSRDIASKTSMVQLKVWEGAYHELHNEPFKKEVFDYILNWVESKTD